MPHSAASVCSSTGNLRRQPVSKPSASDIGTARRLDAATREQPARKCNAASSVVAMTTASSA